MNPRPTSAPDPIRAPGRIRTVDGIPLHVLAEGTGPLCVLSGGLGMAWFDWDAVAALLAPYRTVIRFDRPGLGLSAPAPTPPTLAAEAGRIARVLDLSLSPATVVGHSLAGFHAEGFARLHPRRCAGLVLVDGSTEDDPRPLLPRAVRTACASGVAAALSAAGVPRALGPAARRLIGRAQTVAGHPPHPWERAGYRTSRVLRACVLENATYPYQAAELAALRLCLFVYKRRPRSHRPCRTGPARPQRPHPGEPFADRPLSCTTTHHRPRSIMNFLAWTRQRRVNTLPAAIQVCAKRLDCRPWSR